MRSSIACIRCRRSKVKCVNNGVGTTCRSCENSGRDCSYPPPVAAGSRRRHSLGEKPDGLGEGERRQRPRKSTHTSPAHPGSGPPASPRPHLDALDPRLLTPQLWQELFDLFQVHYSADLPFLHPPTFLKPLRAAPLPLSGAASNGPAPSPQPPASQEFLLAFLALTARFHPKLVSHHSPPTSARASNPLIASEYYAAAAAERLSGFWTDNQLHEIERTQAMLMLGLHEWGMCRGAKAWITIGQAIRCAQAMGLQYELDLDDEPMSRSLALNAELSRIGDGSRLASSVPSKDEGDAFIQQEVRRRTFWSCYIMDRYLSSGKYRPQMLHAKELRIQLPASERSFLFAEKVRTLMLGEEEHSVAGRAEVQSHRQASVLLGQSGTPEPKMAPSHKSVAMQDVDDDKCRLETGEHEGLVSRYIKILEIYGKVVKWSCLGGRRTEEHPPWDQRCEFYQLRKQCLDFKASLPRQHTLTPQNTQAHITMKSSTPYTLIHTVYLLCQVMLHREYVPFIPIRCTKPEGPLDPPLFPKEKYDVPPEFWEESARECFKSAREIMDLVRSCQEWSALVETPIVGFAMYNVAFVGVYCINFPQMDPEGFMCTPKSSETAPVSNGSKVGESKGFEAARKSLEMIGTMRPKLHMADGWFKTINNMHRYFKRMKRDYKKNTAAIESGTSESDGSPISSRHLSLREGGVGGGLDEFKVLERTLKEFGNLEDQQDMEMTDVRPSSGPLENAYDDSNSGTTVKSEEGDHRPGHADPPTSESGQWNAVNAGPGGTASRNDSISTPNSGQFRPWASYTQHNQPPQPPPSPQQQQQPYAQQISNFRDYSQDGGSVAGAPLSLVSPGSHSASTPHASPPFERQHQGYGSWPTHHASYALPPPQQPHAYTNGVPHPHQQPTPMQTGSYPTPAQHPYPSMSAPPPLQEHPQQPWNHLDRDAWLKSIETPIAGDDIAAFVDGGEMADWARGYGNGNGWLSAVWGGPGHAA